MAILSEHRVVTVPQLQRLLDLPERTVRYRLQRLWEAGLAGAGRPYTDRGSSPYHWYPSRRADVLARGQGFDRSGERTDPNEAFLRHAAGITEFYVALRQTCAQRGWHLLTFLREVAGREEFRVGDRRSSIIPDASVVIADGEASYHGLVEIDFGTMSRTRIGAKLACYSAYVRSGAWKQAHPYLPPLFFLTTTERRVDMILSAVAARVEQDRRADTGYVYDNDQPFLAVSACAAVDDPYLALGEGVWSDAQRQDGLGFAEQLIASHAAVAARAQAEAEHLAAAHAWRESLRTDMEVLRAHIHRRKMNFSSHFYGERLDEDSRIVLKALLEATEPMSPQEREAFGFFAARVEYHEPTEEMIQRNVHSCTFTDAEKAAVALLVAATLVQQRRQIIPWARRYPNALTVRQAIQSLDGGHLLSEDHVRGFAEKVKADLAGAKRRHGRVLDYIARRDKYIAERYRESNPLQRLRYSARAQRADHDAAHVGYCPGCMALVTDRGTYQACEHRTEIVELAQALRNGQLVPDGKGFYTAVLPPLPAWVSASEEHIDAPPHRGAQGESHERTQDARRNGELDADAGGRT